MTYIGLIAGALLAFATTALTVPVISRLALWRGWVDRPDDLRKLHDRPTPTIGGIGIFAGFGVGMLYVTVASGFTSTPLDVLPPMFWVGAVLIMGVGFFDDVRGLGFKQKLGVQILVAYLLLYAGYRIDLGGLPFGDADIYDQALFSIPLTMLWIVGVINAVNLIDGVDGLAAGVTLIAFLSLAAIFGLHGEFGLILVALAVAGALAGFLLHNFNPASIFMGDSGSLFLGYVLATVSLSAPTHSDPWLAILVPLVALGFPVLDTGLSVVRRFAARKAICAPDSDHIHHRLLRRLPTRRAVLLLYAVSLCFGLSAILISFLSPLKAYGVLSLNILLGVGFVGMLGYLRRSQVASIPSDVEIATGRMNGFLLQPGGDGHADSILDIYLTSQREPPPGSAPAEDASGDTEDLAGASGDWRPGAAPHDLTDDTPPSEAFDSESLQHDGHLTGVMTETTIVVAGGNLATADLDEEKVVLNMESGQYYGLSEVGARILDLLDEPRSIGEVIATLYEEYDVEAEQLRRDVVEFVQQMVEHRMIRTDEAAA